MTKTQQQDSIITRYKKLLIRSKNLFISPKSEWELILKENNDFNSILSSFVLPYIFVATLLSFVSYLFTHGDFLFEAALKQAIGVFAALFFTYFLSYHILVKSLPGFFSKKMGDTKVKSIAASLIAYSSVSIFVYHIISALLPEVLPLLIIVFYAIYIVWIGLDQLSSLLQKDFKVVLTIIISGLVICLPYILSTIIFQLSNSI